MIIGEKAAKVPSKIIIPALSLALALVFAAICFAQYGFWDAEGSAPTKGFFPGIIAIVLVVISILALVNGIKGPKVEFKLHNWYVPGAMILIILASYVIGLMPSIIVFEILWLKVYEKASWRATLISLGVVLFIAVGCFQIWLGIRFPNGIIYNWIFG